MVKIKTKKQLSLPQLIEWGSKNGIIGKRYSCNEYEDKGVYFNSFGKIEFDNEYSYSANNTFTIEVEEDVTEDTVFSELVGLRADDSYWKYENTCINDFNLEVINAIYIPNDDLTMTLIWKDGKLVE